MLGPLGMSERWHFKAQADYPDLTGFGEPGIPGFWLKASKTTCGGWRTLSHHTGIRPSHGLNFRVPRRLRFSFLQRVWKLIPRCWPRATINSLEFKNGQTHGPFVVGYLR
jgi:hypothetical protein